jgi:hypothetical protein
MEAGMTSDPGIGDLSDRFERSSIVSEHPGLAPFYVGNCPTHT